MAGMSTEEAQRIVALLALELGTRYEISPREREDDERRNRHDESVDPWSYDDPEVEE